MENKSRDRLRHGLDTEFGDIRIFLFSLVLGVIMSCIVRGLVVRLVNYYLIDECHSKQLRYSPLHLSAFLYAMLICHFGSQCLVN